MSKNTDELDQAYGEMIATEHRTFMDTMEMWRQWDKGDRDVLLSEVMTSAKNYSEKAASYCIAYTKSEKEKRER